MPGFSDELKRRLPEIALSILAAKTGGPQALGAFQGGLQDSRQQSQALARQAQLDDERRQQAAAVADRARRDDERADEALQMQRLNAALGTMDRYATGLGETATDPVAAENQLLSRGAGLESAFGLPQGQLSSFVPNMAQAITPRKKRAAATLYAEAEKRFGKEAMESDSLTLDGGELLGPIKPSALRALAGVPTATDETGATVPALLGKTTPSTPGSFEDYLEAPPERRTEIERARAKYTEAGRAPDDPVLGELRQMRLEQAKTGQGTAALAPATQRRVDMKTRAFDQQPVVKRIQTMAESVTFAEGLNPNTTNPADDQALIYAFAKAMDPDSVVREGEYATVQKYAQSWAESFGFNAARIFSNTTFLTPEARSNMKQTIRARFAAARPQYDNLRQSYASQISRITNQGDGDSYLVDYAAGFPAGPQAPAGGGSAPAGAGATYDDYLRSRGQR